jgi:hypothetical protein
METAQLELLDTETAHAESAVTRTNPHPSPTVRQLGNTLGTSTKTLEAALQRIFPTSSEETKVQKARRIMGEDVKNLSDTQLEACLTDFQYLIDSWIDEFERRAFNNQTLTQSLREV